MRFNPIYFFLAIALFVIETLIALYVHDAFIRPYFGDLLIVILMYCAIKAFIQSPPVKTALVVFGIACVIEVSQYFGLVQLLGLGNSKIAKSVLGTYFSFVDILMYAIGILVIIAAETYVNITKQQAIINDEK